jgi:hypothetical protein
MVTGCDKFSIYLNKILCNQTNDLLLEIQREHIKFQKLEQNILNTNYRLLSERREIYKKIRSGIKIHKLAEEYGDWDFDLRFGRKISHHFLRRLRNTDWHLYHYDKMFFLRSYNINPTRSNLRNVLEAQKQLNQINIY